MFRSEFPIKDGDPYYYQMEFSGTINIRAVAKLGNDKLNILIMKF